MKTPKTFRASTSHTFAAAMAVGLLAGIASTPADSAISISKTPLFLPQEVPGNLVLTPSVEWPTLSVAAYKDSTDFKTAGRYTGLFDANFCYAYVYSETEEKRFFDPVSKADASGACRGSKEWSGKFLNWATTQAIDPFRVALTGGNRVKDDPDDTWIEKAWHDGQGDTKQFPHFSTANSTVVENYTPASWESFKMRIEGLGNKMRFTSSGDLNAGTDAVLTYNPDQHALSGGNGSDAGVVYEVFVRVRVCKMGFISDNCTKYSQGYKPEGLIQQYSERLRYSVFGYLNDSDVKRDGAALRARQKFVGPRTHPAMQEPEANTHREWDASTGVLIRNPNPTDASATATELAIKDSGVINYINKFGSMPDTPDGSRIAKHKSYDPVSELYYAATRYLRNIGNVPEYTNNLTYKLADGFPVITDWTDPIMYSCQANVILGIGDVYSHRDRNLPGGIDLSVDEPSVPDAVESDTLVDVEKLTQQMGKLEGLSISGKSPSFGSQGASAYIAGLAYDAHVRDQRSDLVGKQTISTYWMDVAEMQGSTYVRPKDSNQYWLAAKYGGFVVPYDYDPSTRTDALEDSLWTDGDTLPQSGDLRPRNFFLANNPDAMIDGLKEAFSRIVREPRPGSGAALGTTSAQLEANSRLFQARFTSEQWTGELNAHLIDQATGEVTKSPQWRASTLLNARDWKDRKIYTSSSDGTARVAFNATNAPNLPAGVADYLRGDRDKEGGAVGSMRVRVSVLGDIIHSQPVFVPSTTEHSRKNMIYVGANDGMLHAFDADTGREVFAFVPKAVREDTAGLTEYSMASSLPHQHQYFVDGEIAVAEAGDKTYLVGTMGRGKPGVFALDVTNPESMSVVWDKTGADIPQLGNVLSRPVIAQHAEDSWSVMLGNGPNSVSGGAAALIMIGLRGSNLSTGATRIVHPGAATDTDSGLSGLVVWRSKPNGYFDTAYAGDLKGNLWKITGLENKKPSSVKLFNAGRPISIPPQVARRPNSGSETWVFFGTGRYLGTADVGSMAVETWYGIKDDGKLITGRDKLKERKIMAEGNTPGGDPVRALSAGTMSDLAGKSGWYIDLKSPSKGAEGERMVSPMIFQGLALVAATLIPNATDPCGAGARSWVMAIDPFTGGRLGESSYFDVNDDGQFDGSDALVDGDESMANSGLGLETGVAGINSLGRHIFASRFDGETAELRTNRATGDPERVSWRELILGMGGTP
ncbi:hypothetical protein GCM10007164_26010 [Luteimonas padinae]|uniref:Pilus assembly protein n=1 Tax=Luteimonas padinae TaxID=1714359 RepID=A0ABV6SU05_9GAMM|nr:PilC/PilY family type IV pilus protein [Luteimonas padinae]GHD74833.1 hypothetical protein GCM10007164_26010 [Luteimonas padinae]